MVGVHAHKDYSTLLCAKQLTCLLSGGDIPEIVLAFEMAGWLLLIKVGVTQAFPCFYLSLSNTGTPAWIRARVGTGLR